MPLPASFGLSPAGLVIPLYDDIRTVMVEDYNVDLAAQGLPPLDESAPGQAVPTVMDTLTARLAEAYQMLQAVHVGRTLPGSRGQGRDDLLSIVGVPLKPASNSTVVMALTGTPGAAIPAGRIFEGGGVDGRARWVTLDDVFLDGTTGLANVAAQAEDTGAITAIPGAITTISTGIAGLTSVTNAAAAVPGRARETDPEKLERRAASLAASGSGNVPALVAGLLGLDYIDTALVLQNTDISAPTTIGGVTVPAGGIAIVLYPAILSSEQATEVAKLVYEKGPSAVEYAGAVVVSVAVTGQPSDSAVDIQWDYGTEVPVTHTTVVTLFPGYVLADVQTQVEAVVDAHYAALGLGDGLEDYDLSGKMHAASIEGIKGVAFTWDDGSGPTAADITPDNDEFYTLAGQTTT